MPGSPHGNCRFCGIALEHVCADLGSTPLANSYLTAEQVRLGERYYPLRALVCAECGLVQLAEYESAEVIFGDYAYFSSVSSSWIEHSQRFAELAIAKLELGATSRVVEVASNDGYLLQFFRAHGIPALGIEPAGNVAQVAIERGIPTLIEFFGVQTARRLAGEWSADLLIGNNVLPHVPDLNDFVAGLAALLAPEGTLTMEFPHLLNLIDRREYDTIYHEHFSYFSFETASRVFERHGVRLFDVEELPTHGGSLRIWGRRLDGDPPPRTERAEQLLARERDFGLDRVATYERFQEAVGEAKRALLEFMIGLRRAGHKIAGYGAPAKGNTLLNFCGIGNDFVDFTVDASPHKQGLFLPGTRLPILAPSELRERRPDVVLILPWNLRDEIVAEHSYIYEWGGRFAVPAPTPALV